MIYRGLGAKGAYMLCWVNMSIIYQIKDLTEIFSVPKGRNWNDDPLAVIGCKKNLKGVTEKWGFGLCQKGASELTPF